MKTLTVASLTVFCTALLSLQARADEPQAIKLAPQIQAMLAELLKTADAEPAPDTAPANPPIAPEAAATAPAAKAPVSAANQPATSLRTSSLRAGGLMTSASLGGHGLIGGAPRLTDVEWRQQFPAHK